MIDVPMLGANLREVDLLYPRISGRKKPRTFLMVFHNSTVSPMHRKCYSGFLINQMKIFTKFPRMSAEPQMGTIKYLLDGWMDGCIGELMDTCRDA